MAEQHKKADGTQTVNGDIPVVAPMNIGKGLLWDPATKTYYVAIDERMFEVDELGRLKLRVSALEDNQLKVRDDGIYQGNTARPELRNLYVDAVNGVDQDPLKVEGAGTRAKPLKTLAYALRQAEKDTKRWVFLKENQDHIFSQREYVTTIPGEIYVTLYGEEWDKSESGSNIDWLVRRQEFFRRGLFPRLKFTDFDIGPYLQQYTRIITTAIHVSNNTSLRFDTVAIENIVAGAVQKVAGLEAEKLAVVEHNRIRTELGGSVTLHYVDLKQTANLTENGVPLATENERIGLIFPTNGTLVIDRIVSLPTSFQGKIVGHNGWAHPLNGAATVSTKLAPVFDVTAEAVNSKITVFGRDVDGSVIAPRVDVPHNLFT